MIAPKPSSAIVDGRLVRTSVSMIKTFGHRTDEPVQSGEGCNRKFHYKYVMGLPDKTTRAQEVGTQVHKEIEHYLKTGEDVLGDIARAGKKYIPEPGEGLLIEHEFSMDLNGVKFGGFIDLVNPRDGVLELVDWKTTGKIQGPWATKPGDLLTANTGHGVQMQGYAAWALQAFPGITRVNLRHVYFQTKGPNDARNIVAPADLQGIGKQWEIISRRVDAMQVFASEKDPLQVPTNEKACKAYGGCPYAKQCGLKTATRNSVFGFTGGSTGMSLIDKFKKTATPITPTIPAPIAQAQPIPPSSAPPARRMVIQDESTPIEPVAKPPEPAPAFVTGAWYETSKGTGQCMGRTASAFAFEGQTGKFLIGFTESTMWKEIPEPMPESTHTATPTPSEETTQESTQKRGRGRPAGVKNRTPEQIAADTRAEMAPPAHVKAEPGTSTATPIPWSSGQGFRLFVDCVPSGPSQNLARYIAEKAEKVCKALDEDDIRLVEYGKGKGALAAVVREELPADGDWVVYSGELSSIVIEALEPLAAFVVRGVR